MEFNKLGGPAARNSDQEVHTISAKGSKGEGGPGWWESAGGGGLWVVGFQKVVVV